MSANGETDVVMRGVLYGACDYLVKPVRIEELRNIWQHVVRRRGIKETMTYRDELAGSDEWEDLIKLSTQDNGPRGGNFIKRKRRLSESDEQQLSVNTSKKARVVWSVELHQQFVKAINHLGIDKAVPKRILEVMNIQGLTRENVASHLQKYRLYLKRLSGVTPEPFPIASFQAYDNGATFGGTMQIQTHPASRTGSLLRTTSGPADLGTLETLKQLQALQQAAHEKGKLEAGLIDVSYSVARNLDFASGRLTVDPPKNYDPQITSGDVIELEGRLDFDNDDELFR